MSTTASESTRSSKPGSAEVPPPGKWHETFRRITQGNAIISVLAVFLALIVGGIMIAFTDEDVQAASAYFFARPMDTIAAVWDAVSGAYVALFLTSTGGLTGASLDELPRSICAGVSPSPNRFIATWNSS